MLDLINDSTQQVKIGGMVGSIGSFIATLVFKQLNTPVLITMPSPAQAEAMLDDLSAVAGSENVGFIPPASRHPYDSSPLAVGPKNERVDSLLRLNSNNPSIYVTLPEALIEKSPDHDWIKRHTIRLQTNESVPRELLLMELTAAGYRRESMVNAQGQFSVRGALLDIYPYGHENPLRIEYDEDVILGMRWFNPTSQRSLTAVENVVLLVGEETVQTESSLLNLLSDKAVLFWHGRDEIEARIERFHERAATAFKKGISRGNLKPEDIYGTLDEINIHARKFRQVAWSELEHGSRVDIDFAASQPDPYPPGVEDLPAYLKNYFDKKFQVFVTTGTSGERERLDELFQDHEIDDIRSISPTLSAGFTCNSLGLAVLTSHELFNRRRLKARHTRFRRRSVQFDRLSLHKGDLVVHAEYGIGKYEGLQTVKVRGIPQESLRIRYAEDTILYIKIEHFGLVDKYTGMDSAKPKLSRIGTKDWDRAKKKTRKAIEDMADELIALYSKRKVVKGHAFPEDTHWQREMEASFEFEDTPDQAITTREIKEDMQKLHPMDRLLSGDVGFGKTEVAIRAAFKAVQDSHQVAVLVPTTILAQQHYLTFRERFSSYPVRTDVLSRFRTSAEQKETIRDMKEGLVDVVIGTHRLLSKDVEFHKLGLLIIDEEHRFGVRHKERLKQLKTNVDVLTMTATPIPRTMQMALMGARDTSQINTPPVDRLPIQTEIHPWSEDLIREAILREIDRQGQVFFLHNRVQSISAVKSMLERLVPGATYGIGHGQMPERALEKVMSDFMHGRYDVLITTMIIESGLDIPNANTLIVNRADRFGLAQLYQVRGRIGRSNRQAYAYLLTPPKLALTNDARRRLSTLSELTDLGSGFKIAMRDLEIRGAGNMLGSQQSGFINAVGFDLYTQILENVVSKMKGEEIQEAADAGIEDVKIEFNGSAMIPAAYIEDSDLRYNFYRRLSSATSMEQIAGLEEELLDRFGAFPYQAGNLLAIVRLKVMGRIAGFKKISILKKRLSAVLNLPSDSEQSQKILGLLVSRADPEPVEFKLGNTVELIYRFNSGDALMRARKFLRHLTREGILQN